MRTFALITGASGGIGFSLARELAKRNINVLLVARSGDKLSENCEAIKKEFGVEAYYLATDLSATTGLAQLIHWIDDQKYSVSILVNNAGYGLWGSLENLPLSDWENMMKLNMNSVVNLCHHFIPILKKQPKAYILNVASTAAYQAVPFLTTYAATKAFVVLFSRGLRWELRDTSVSVSCLSPGATDTGFMDRAKMEALRERANAVSMTPDQVAAIAIRKMFAGQAEIVPGFLNWISVKLTYWVPKKLTERIAFGLYRK